MLVKTMEISIKSPLACENMKASQHHKRNTCIYMYIYIPHIAKARDNMKRICFPHVRNPEFEWHWWRGNQKQMDGLNSHQKGTLRYCSSVIGNPVACHMSTTENRDRLFQTKKTREPEDPQPFVCELRTPGGKPWLFFQVPS